MKGLDLKNVKKVSKVLKAFANTDRLQILCLLSEKEMNVSQLLEQSTLSQSSLSQHLKILRENGMLKNRKDGQCVYYKIKDDKALAIMVLLHDLYCS